MVRVLISTGEVSGDLQGALLIDALKEEAAKRKVPLEIMALGGPRMKAAGAFLIADTSPMGAIGLLEALPFVLPTARLQARVDNLLKSAPPDVVVLIDYMGPNIRLGRKLSKVLPSVPINYYIAPQEWAWRLGEGGTTKLITFTDLILAIFPAEAEFYAERGAKVTWVGHPLIDTVKPLPDCQQARDQLGLEPGQKILLLMPASRSQELRYLMPTLAKAAALIQKHDPSLQVIVPAGQQSFEEPLQLALKDAGATGRVLSSSQCDELKPSLFALADLALGKSGTVNIELALHGVPQIVGYRVSRLTALVARHILRFKVDHISPVNLLLNERLIPELVQEDFTPESIADLSISLLENKSIRAEMLKGYDRLRDTLGQPGVTGRAAKAILNSV